jgi:hypothetical protein
MRIFLFVLAATMFEAAGDAIVRVALQSTVQRSARVGIFLLGALLLTLYGTSLNLAPIEFASVTGMYVATVFVMFQISNYVFFHTLPTVPVLVGGSLIVAGGAVITFWR